MNGSQVWNWPLFQRDIVARERLVNALQEADQLRCAGIAVRMISGWWRTSTELVLPDNPEAGDLAAGLVRDVNAFQAEDILATWEGEAAVAAWVDQMQSLLSIYRLQAAPSDPIGVLQQRLWWALYFFIQSVHVWRTRPWRLPQAVSNTLWAAGRGVAEYRVLVHAPEGTTPEMVQEEVQAELEDFVRRIWGACQRI